MDHGVERIEKLPARIEKPEGVEREGSAAVDVNRAADAAEVSYTADQAHDSPSDAPNSHSLPTETYQPPTSRRGRLLGILEKIGRSPVDNPDSGSRVDADEESSPEPSKLEVLGNDGNDDQGPMIVDTFGRRGTTGDRAQAESDKEDDPSNAPIERAGFFVRDAVVISSPATPPADVAIFYGGQPETEGKDAPDQGTPTGSSSDVARVEDSNVVGNEDKGDDKGVDQSQVEPTAEPTNDKPSETSRKNETSEAPKDTQGQEVDKKPETSKEGGSNSEDREDREGHETDKEPEKPEKTMEVVVWVPLQPDTIKPQGGGESPEQKEEAQDGNVADAIEPTRVFYDFSPPVSQEDPEVKVIQGHVIKELGDGYKGGDVHEVSGNFMQRAFDAVTAAVDPIVTGVNNRIVSSIEFVVDGDTRAALLRVEQGVRDREPAVSQYYIATGKTGTNKGLLGGFRNQPAVNLWRPAGNAGTLTTSIVQRRIEQNRQIAEGYHDPLGLWSFVVDAIRAARFVQGGMGFGGTGRPGRPHGQYIPGPGKGVDPWTGAWWWRFRYVPNRVWVTRDDQHPPELN